MSGENSPSVPSPPVQPPQAWTFTAAEHCKERFPGAPGCCFLKKGTGYEKRSAPGMVSGRSGGPPAAACTLEFDTDLFDGDMKTADGEVVSFLFFRCMRVDSPNYPPIGPRVDQPPLEARAAGCCGRHSGGKAAGLPRFMPHPPNCRTREANATLNVDTFPLPCRPWAVQAVTWWWRLCQMPTAARAAPPLPAAARGPWRRPASAPTACPTPAAAASSRWAVGAVPGSSAVDWSAAGVAACTLHQPAVVHRASPAAVACSRSCDLLASLCRAFTCAARGRVDAHQGREGRADQRPAAGLSGVLLAAPQTYVRHLCSFAELCML